MATAGQLQLAADYCAQFGLPAATLDIDPAALEAEAAARRDAYLQLALPPGAVLFVDTPAHIEVAAAALRRASVVGVDVEWKAATTSGGGANGRASLLQARCSGALYCIYLYFH